MSKGRGNMADNLALAGLNLIWQASPTCVDLVKIGCNMPGAIPFIGSWAWG